MHCHGHPRLGERKVAIMGGGIGGLAAAVALQQDGANVTVYERDVSFEDRKQGYGLTLTHNEQGPLAKLGILDTIKARDEEQSPSRRHWIFSSDGVILGYYGNDYAPPSVERTQRGNLRIPRQELRTILLQRLRPGTVQWGKRLVGFNVICGQRRQTKRPRLHQNAKSDKNVQGTTVGDDKDMVGVNKKTCVEEEKKVAAEEPKEEDDTVVLQFADGSTVSDVAVLIGADGIRSRTRDLMDAAPQPQPEKAHRRSEHRHEASALEAEAFGALHCPQTATPRDPDPDLLVSPPNPFLSASAGTPTISSGSDDAPHYTGVFIILGISTLRHPLLHEGGFYTLDGTHRLFTMPFKGTDGLTMWQLSFRLPNFADALALLSGGVSGEDEGGEEKEEEEMGVAAEGVAESRGASGESASSNSQSTTAATTQSLRLMREVLRRCAHWHEPVCSMVRLSDPSNVWGTPLFDRVPRARHEGIARGGGVGGGGEAAPAKDGVGPPGTSFPGGKDKRCGGVACQRVVALLGDAAHPMTPFKGQGANQALGDAVRLGSWLRRAPASKALKNYTREMVAASSKKVIESRAAAELLHSERVLPRRLRQKKHPCSCKNESGGDSSSKTNESGETLDDGSCVGAQEEAVGVEDSVDDSDGGYGPNGILRFAGVADVHMFTLLGRLRKLGVGARRQNDKERGSGGASDGGGRTGDLVSDVRVELEAMEAEIGVSARESRPTWGGRRKRRQDGSSKEDQLARRHSK